MLPMIDPGDEALIRDIAAAEGMVGDVRFFDLVGGCGTNATLIGRTWRVFDPETMRAFVLCLAETIRVEDVAPLGLDMKTPFICRESALDEETARYLRENASVKVI